MSTYVRKIKHEEADIMTPSDLQARYCESLTLVPSTTATTDGNGDDVDVGDYIEAIIFANVSSVSGTDPTLDIVIEGKDPISGNYATIDSFPTITSTGTYVLQITNFGKTIRARWTVGGTSPSFTFSVGGWFKT